MAEALAVVGIVANIVQLVDFGTRVLKRLNEYQSSLAEIPEAFRNIKSELPVLLDALRQTKAAIDAGLLQDESKKALIPAVEGCGVQIKELDTIIEKVLPVLSDSWARRSRKALRSLRSEAKVERIVAAIRGYVQTLTYHGVASSKTPAGYTLPPPTPSSTVPFRRDDDFISRDSLVEIRQICARPAGRAALVGLGGVGKSQIAIEYAYQVRDESPKTWVFWVHAGTRARFLEGYRKIAETTRMDGWDNPKADILQLVHSWLCNESNGRWALVVDNADDLDVLFPPHHTARETNPLSDFLPQSPNGSILITSRSRDVAFKLTGTFRSVLNVKPMNEDDGQALLQKKLCFTPIKHEAVELLHVLDCMPLAITQAVAYIVQRAPRMTISRYLDEIRRNDTSRSRLLEKDVGDSRRDGQASNSIIATWQISFEHIQKKMPTAARLLSLLSLFDRQGIPEWLVHDRYAGNGDEEADFEEDIYTLTSYSLIEISANGSKFEMHRLVQFTTKQWLEISQGLEQWKCIYSILMNDNYPTGRHENWKVCQELFPHVQTLEGCHPEDSTAREAWASVLFKAAWYSSVMGQYETAHRLGSVALTEREHLLGRDHVATLSSLNSLGMVLNWQGKYNDAEKLHHRNVQTKSRVLGAEHPDTLTSMSNLAMVYSNQGRWKEAEGLELQVIEARKRVLGEEDQDTLTSIGSLALTYWNQGRWKEAEELQAQVMETRKRLLGDEHPDALTSIANMSLMYKSQGRWKEAEELQVQVMQAEKRVLGEEHPDTLTSIANIASIYRHQGRWKEAEELELQVMESRKRLLGEEHPYTLTSIASLSLTYWNQGRLEEAEELGSQVVEARKRVLGEEHPDTLMSIANLASTYWNQGRLKEAEELELQVMETRKRVLGEEHPSTLTSMSNLAFTLTSQSRKQEAIELMRTCATTRRRILGSSHPDTENSLATLNYWESRITP